jgi:hypothetical protein
MATGFAASFWSSDYAGGTTQQAASRRLHLLTCAGLGVLFGKLQQGVQENQQIITVARMRADAEEQYATSLASINPATERITGGFGRDEGASVRKVSRLCSWELTWSCSSSPGLRRSPHRNGFRSTESPQNRV